METKAIVTKEDLVNAALDHVYPDADALLKDSAKEFALVNMGQVLEKMVAVPSPRFTPKPQYVIVAAYDQFRGDAACEGIGDPVNDEYKSWLKQLKKVVARVKKAKQPLTVRNVHLAWEEKGPFAK